MRWLFVKDMQILRRSPLVTALLIVYPIAIAVLIGFALSRGPEKPRVAFLNQVPVGTPLVLGGTHFNIAGARNELCSRIDCIPVSSEAEARQKVTSGDVLAALILPKDLVSNLESLAGLNPTQPAVRVLVNEEDPVKAAVVTDRINSLVTQANLKISKKVVAAAAGYIDLIVRGGTLNFLGQSFSVLGLSKTGLILTHLAAELRPTSPLQLALGRVLRFASLARQNLNLAKPLLSSVSHPIDVDTEVVSGSPPSLDSFAISVSATLTLMFVTVLLVAGSLALEREEDRGRRVRRLRGGDRRARRRGPRELAARVHDLAADRVPVAGSLGDRQPRPLSCARGCSRAVPVPPRARRVCRRARSGRGGDRAGPAPARDHRRRLRGDRAPRDATLHVAHSSGRSSPPVGFQDPP